MSLNQDWGAFQPPFGKYPEIKEPPIHYFLGTANPLVVRPPHPIYTETIKKAIADLTYNLLPMINLPENPTPEQFAQAEPLIVKAIIEETYTDGIDNVDFRRVKPGQYTGEFRDGKKRFQFDFEADKGINYKPINPEEID